MTSLTSLLAGVLLAYLASLFALSVYANRRVHNQEDYLVAGRSLPLYLAWGTLLATWFGAATILGAAEAARQEGVRGTILDPFASGSALVVAGLFFAKPLWRMRLLTLADFYGREFGPRSEVLASLIMIPGYFGWIAAQYLALAGLQQTFFGIPPSWGILIACGVVLAYTLMGGMWSVTLTDTAQMMVVLVTLVVLAAATLSQLGGGSLAAGLARLLGETPRDRLTLLPAAGGAACFAWLATWCNGVFGNIPGQDLMQRVFASRDEKTAQQACLLAGAVYILFGLLPVGLGLAAALLFPADQQGQILTLLAAQYLTPTLSVVFLVSLVSIIMSTCTSAVLSPAAVLGNNLLGKLAPLRHRMLLVNRLSVLLVAAAGVVVAYSGRTILELLELSLSIGFVTLFVPLVMGLYGRPRGEWPALLAMIFGVAIWLPRESLELLLPLPGDAQVCYAQYVGEQGAAAGWPVWTAVLASWLAAVPSAISGTTASFAGYLAGQALTRRTRPASS